MTAVVAVLLLIWFLSVVAWRQVVLAYSGERIDLLVAARHLALLLLGKYIPGGVWGFLARLGDSASRLPATQMLAAGLAEQWMSLSTITLVSLVALASFGWQSASVFVALALVPMVVVVTSAWIGPIVTVFGRLLPARFRDAIGSMDARGSLRVAACIALLQQSSILALVAGVAMKAFGLGFAEGAAVAGSYGLGVAAGIAAVFAPGGILVREGVFIALSSAVMPPAQATALAAAMRLAFTASDLAVGGLTASWKARRSEHV
ncbi:hypothetical protein [Luteimonas gilva]|uniref:hypothetical protein n=1 Tax=Luteimonas gilva TaxID=2572684 RepID=UPI0016754FA5|nr:hypothetical protein [Luteimonas gilva]